MPLTRTPASPTKQQEQLKAYLLKFHHVTDQILSDYVTLWTAISIPRKTIITAPGETEQFFYFITEGIHKSHLLNGNKQHIIAFAHAPSFSGIPESFFTQQPSRYYLESITATEGLKISSHNHQMMLQKHEEINTLFRKITETFLTGVLQRQHELMSMTMETRFRTFVERSAYLLHKVPHKDIASYLNIDATNFSKLMNSIRI
ncbi:Crp/Fnr family transcriptional regulator [Roseivirga sp.]|uniref:Crp/Fnr family transcriptional regulator n=1 Tax=Roseivirga sp. TaxID=1964215 RepID=UPI003B517845